MYMQSRYVVDICDEYTFANRFVVHIVMNIHLVDICDEYTFANCFVVHTLLRPNSHWRSAQFHKQIDTPIIHDIFTNTDKYWISFWSPIEFL